MSNNREIIQIIDQAKENLSPDLLMIILGPTASGKTNLAVEIAKERQGEIISADSRQVYRGMDIGTGKDLSEYGNIHHHLIDITEPGETYNADLFRQDFFAAYDDIIFRGKLPILCGGSGSYIHTVLQDNPYSQIPKDIGLQEELTKLSKEELIFQIQRLPIPIGFNIDFNNHKRLVRSLEILQYLDRFSPNIRPQRTVQNYLVFGLNPSLEQRRTRITQRLKQRLENGLIAEIDELLRRKNIPAETLIRYGLEYKYASLYLQGKLSYDSFVEKLNIEIHRYAKRQMTYFRKMEKDGIPIHWL